MPVGYVFVSGGDRGIGRATVLRFGEAGYHVAFSYYTRRGAAEETLIALRGVGGEGFYVQMDVSNPESVSRAFREVSERFPYLNVLVNNAGILHDKPFEETSLEDWERVLRVNLTGVFLVTKAFLPLLKRAPWATIVNVSSVSAQTPGVASAAYSASKGGLISLTRKLAAELAPHIRVNAVAPSFVATDMTRKYLEDPEMLERVKELHLLRDVATPEDIAEAIFFLGTPASRFITGEVMNINGGRYMG